MNLQELKQEEREKYEDCDDGPMGMPCDSCSTALTLIDTLIDKVVAAVEEKLLKQADVRNLTYSEIQSAFRNFKGT